MGSHRIKRIAILGICLVMVLCAQSAFAWPDDPSEQRDVVSEEQTSETQEETETEQTTEIQSTEPEQESETSPSIEAVTKKGESKEKATESSSVEDETKPEVKSRSSRAVHNDVITEINALLQDGSGQVENVSLWQVFMLDAKFALPDGEVKAGDTTVISLPQELLFFSTTSFDIKDESGNLVAVAEVNGSDKTLTLTYTDYPETHSGVNGHFHFYVQVDRNVVSEETDIPLIFDVSGETVIGATIHYNGTKDPSPYYLSKSGSQMSTDDPRHIRYHIKINTIKQDINNLVFTDHIQTAGVTYDKESLTILKGRWAINNGDWSLYEPVNITNNYTVNWNDEDASFSIDFGDISADEGILIRYTTTSNYDYADGERIRNKGVITGSNIETTEKSENIAYHIAGGAAEGYTYSIKIIKENVEGDTLAGATFKVVRASNEEEAGTVTTGSNGEAEVTGLLKDQYEIIEVDPPEGYTVSNESIIVDTSDFGSDKVAEVTVTDAVETISIPVEKEWVGDPQQQVIVNLIADGVTLTETELSAENNWRYTFDDLPKYDISDGHEIVYDVEESPIEGYNQGKSGTTETGYTFVNTITGKVSVPVTKVWLGPSANDAEVALYANDRQIDTVKLSADNNWQHTFAGLEKYNNGEEISYTVKENEIAGYSSSIKGDSINGYVITNTSAELIDIPVHKIWVGTELESATVRLFADGTEITSAELNAGTGWSHTFSNLFKYDASDGHEILYEIKEDPVEGYTTGISGTQADGYTITNTIEGRKSVPVTKVWKGPAAESADVNLLADGQNIKVVSLNPGNNWQHTFTNLPAYSDDGREISYTISESPVEGYASSITGDAETGFTITNIKEDNTTSDEDDFNGSDEGTSDNDKSSSNSSNSTSTGDRSNIIKALILLVLSAAVVVLILAYRRRENDLD